MFRLAALVLGLTLSAGVASAAVYPVVNFDEANESDLPDFWQIADEFTLGNGVNTISGTFTWPLPGRLPNEGDRDCFWFWIPPESKLTSASVSTTDVAGDIGVTAFAIRAPAGTIVAEIGGAVPGNHAFPALPGDMYVVEQVGASGIGTGAYTFTFNVEPVPEPAPLATLGLASGALLARQFRRVCFSTPR